MTSRVFSLLTFTSLVLVSTAAHAQFGDRVVAAPTTMVSPPATESAAGLTRDMSTRLKLNEAQFIKLYQVNKTRVTQTAQLERNYKNDPAALNARKAELEAQYEQECSRILTPSQLSQLREEKPLQPSTAPAGTGNGLG